MGHAKVWQSVFKTPPNVSDNVLCKKTVNGLNVLTNFAKSSILDARLGSEYAPAKNLVLKLFLFKNRNKNNFRLIKYTESHESPQMFHDPDCKRLELSLQYSWIFLNIATHKNDCSYR